MLMFRREDRGRVAAGEITLTFRLWRSPHVVAGRRYATGFGDVHVDRVEVLPAALVARRDIARTGCASLADVWALAGEHTGARVGPDTLLYRVEFRFLGATERPAPAELPGNVVLAKLERMDLRSARGPWTRALLSAIAARPRVAARLLAAEAGWETPDFKAHVRRLKALGLTISHEVGYELTDAGRRALGGAAASRRPRPAAARRSPRTPRRSR